MTIARALEAGSAAVSSSVHSSLPTRGPTASPVLRRSARRRLLPASSEDSRVVAAAADKEEERQVDHLFTPMSLADFPVELLLMVIDYLADDQLKRTLAEFMFSCRKIYHIGLPYLLRVITVRPSTTGFNFSNLMNFTNDSLKSNKFEHVKSLVVFTPDYSRLEDDEASLWDALVRLLCLNCVSANLEHLWIKSGASRLTEAVFSTLRFASPSLHFLVLAVFSDGHADFDWSTRELPESVAKVIVDSNLDADKNDAILAMLQDRARGLENFVFNTPLEIANIQKFPQLATKLRGACATVFGLSELASMQGIQLDVLSLNCFVGLFPVPFGMLSRFDRLTKLVLTVPDTRSLLFLPALKTGTAPHTVILNSPVFGLTKDQFAEVAEAVADSGIQHIAFEVAEGAVKPEDEEEAEFWKGLPKVEWTELEGGVEVRISIGEDDEEEEEENGEEEEEVEAEAEGGGDESGDVGEELDGADS